MLGGLSAVSSGVGAVASHQQGQAQAAAQNRQIANEANQRNAQYELNTLQGIAQYNTAKIDTEVAQDSVAMAVRRNISNERLRQQDLDDQLRLALTDLSAKRMLSEKAAEGGRSKNYNKNPLLELGRAEGALYANREREKIAGYRNMREATRQGNAKRQELYASIATPYRAGPAPSQEIEFVEPPSTLGLIANLGSAAIGGYSTAYSLTPS